MSGWVPALLLIGGATLFLIGFNMRLWRAMQAQVQQRAAYSDADLLNDAAARGHDAEITAAARKALRGWYPPDLVPKLDDRLADFAIHDDVAVSEALALCWRALDIAALPPDGSEPAPETDTVADLIAYVESRRAELRESEREGRVTL